VSEGLCLVDPEGNGLEIYADRSPKAWPRRGEVLGMYTRPLGVGGLMGDLRQNGHPWDGIAPATRLGHVHLKVADLDREAFYRLVIGLERMQRFGDSAAFLSTGGYPHHIGLNS